MQPCKLKDLSGWLEAEVCSTPIESHRRVILEVNHNLSDFVKWSERAELLWQGCDRTVDYHSFPDSLNHLFKERKLKRDTRSNGPAVAAFQVAGGNRPMRASGNGCISITSMTESSPTPAAKECPSGRGTMRGILRRALD